MRPVGDKISDRLNIAVFIVAIFEIFITIMLDKPIVL
jgi:hypothetical protein